MNKIKQILMGFCLIFIFNIKAQVYKPGSEPQPAAPKTETKFPEASQFEKSNITYKLINAANNTFCYDIFADGKLMIHQPSAPGMPGNEGFKTKADAEKVAQLVVTKIKKGEMPPSVTTDELKKLKVTTK
jgi:hypothetical protein